MLTLRLPTESVTASTTGLQVQLPEDSPLAEVSVHPVPTMDLATVPTSSSDQS
jgi:hypothetical protein